MNNNKSDNESIYRNKTPGWRLEVLDATNKIDLAASLKKADEWFPKSQ